MRDHHPLPFGTLGLPIVDPLCRLIVTIPAKDEAQYITLTLDALRRQTGPMGTRIDPARYEVIVLANNCRDATAAVIRRYARDYPRFRLHVVERRFPPAIAAVGTARRLLMDTALLRLESLGLNRGVICTTDADTLVGPEWIYHTLHSVANGAEAVGGRIVVPPADRAGNEDYRKYHLQDVTYRSLQYCLESMIDPDPADPWPRHFQNFGPSTAVTTAAYRACGGIPPLKSLEDVGLVRALTCAGIQVTHNRNVRVRTSSRVSHRVEGTAFSHQLDEWATMTARREPQRVIGLTNCRRLFKWKVALRHAVRHKFARRNGSLRELADTLGWPFESLEERILTAKNYAGLYQEIRDRLEACPRFAGCTIERAIHDMRGFTSSLRHRSFGTDPAGIDRHGQLASS